MMSEIAAIGLTDFTYDDVYDSALTKLNAAVSWDQKL